MLELFELFYLMKEDKILPVQKGRCLKSSLRGICEVTTKTTTGIPQAEEIDNSIFLHWTRKDVLRLSI
jgi:hypothetical protein